MSTIKSVFSALKGSPALAISVLGGAAAGSVGGFMLGDSTATSLAYGAGLGTVGVAGGALLGNAIERRLDQTTAAPLGVKMVSNPKVQPGKEVEFSFKPPATTVDKAMEDLSQKLSTIDDPELKAMRPGWFQRMFAKNTSFKVKATASEDGSSLTVGEVTMVVPGRSEPVTFQPKGITLALKDGRIDENNPENKAKIREMMTQGVQQTVPEQYQALATEVVNTTLSKADTPVQPLVEPPSMEKLANTAMNVMTKPTVGVPGTGVQVPTGIPFLPPGGGRVF